MNTTPPPHHSGLLPAAVDALLLDTTPYLSCEECFERMDTYMERLLADPDHLDPAMDRHLDGCAACQEEAASLRELLTANDS